MWKSQREIGTTVLAEDIALRLRIPEKQVHARMMALPNVGFYYEYTGTQKLGPRSYYTSRNPARPPARKPKSS